ncbi:15742_t:CDS:10, partial [Cetraspora pellucida]
MLYDVEKQKCDHDNMECLRELEASLGTYRLAVNNHQLLKESPFCQNSLSLKKQHSLHKSLTVTSAPAPTSKYHPDNKEIIKASINLIWKVTDEKVISITFNNPILSANIALDNGTSTVIRLDVPNAVLLDEDNYRKLRTELTRKGSITIVEEKIEDFNNDIQANANRIGCDDPDVGGANMFSKPSTLTDSLPCDDQILNPSNEKDLLHPDIVNAETSILTKPFVFHSSSNKINESTLIINKFSKITLENSQQANNPIDEITHDPLQENNSVDVHNNNQRISLTKAIAQHVESSNSNDSEFSELDDDTGLKQSSAGSNLQLNYSEIAIQKIDAQFSSFNIDSTNKKSSFFDNLAASESNDQLYSDIKKDQNSEVQSLDFVVLPLNHKENDKDLENEVQNVGSVVQPLNYDESDKYFEEIDELIFDVLDSRQQPSVTQSNHPSNKTNISRSDIVNVKTGVVESNRNVRDNQHASEMETEYPIFLIPSTDTNSSSSTKDHTEFLRDNKL